jgi:hypothetical protein
MFHLRILALPRRGDPPFIPTLFMASDWELVNVDARLQPELSRGGYFPERSDYWFLDFVWNLRGSDEEKRGTGRLTFHSRRPRKPHASTGHPIDLSSRLKPETKKLGHASRCRSIPLCRRPARSVSEAPKKNAFLLGLSGIRLRSASTAATRTRRVVGTPGLRQRGVVRLFRFDDARTQTAVPY